VIWGILQEYRVHCWYFEHSAFSSTPETDAAAGVA